MDEPYEASSTVQACYKILSAYSHERFAMPLSLNIWNVALLLGAAQGIFLAAFLAFHKKNRIANRILAVFLSASAVIIASPEIVRQYYAVFPHLIALTFTLTFLLGPLIFFYVEHVLAGVKTRFAQNGQKISRTAWPRVLHLLPFLMSTIYLLPFYVREGKHKVEFFQTAVAAGLPLDFMIIWGLQCLHVVFYFGVIYQKLEKHAERMKSAYAQIEKINLAWLQRLSLANAGVWLLYLIFFLLYAFKIAVDPFGVLDYVFGYARSVLVYAIGYMGLKQPEIFFGSEAESLARQNGKKYERSGLMPEVADKYARKLLHSMETDQPFKNADLTLPELAAILAIPPNHLSQVINDKFDRNFFDFINSYRIKEAQRALLDPGQQHLTILAIAYEAGFNSKSAFNAAFKKYTDMTPSQFKKMSNPAR